MKQALQFIFILFLLLLNAVSVRAQPVKVLASFSVLGDLAHQIGGDYISVVVLVGPDGDAHIYQPTPADAKNIAQAGLVIMNGLGFEGWMDRLIQASGYRGQVVVASAAIPNVLSGSVEKKDITTTPVDPHAWQDLKNGEVYVRNIALALVKADPIHEVIYQQNAKNIILELATLDHWVHQQINGIPVRKRSVISSHNAFGYFARAYGIIFIAPVGLSTEEEPSAEELKRLVEIVRSGKTHALFLENMADSKLVSQLSRETGVTLGGKLYADALSPETGPAATYQQMFKYNVAQLVAAMQMNQ